MKHSDIESPLPPSEEGAATKDSILDQQNQAVEDNADIVTPVDADQSRDGDDSDTCPATPVAGKRKRDRQWVWTLGPVQPAVSGLTSESSVTAEDAETMANR